MGKFKITKEKVMKIKDIVIFILLFLWIVIPIFQSIKSINEIIVRKNIYFNLIKTIGIMGIGTGIVILYNKFKEANNKKTVIKEFLPIFLFVLYMIWTLNSCFKAARRDQAFYGNSYRKEGYFMYLNYAGFFLCSMLLENKKLRKILLNTFIITSIFITTINVWAQDNFNKVLGNSNFYGYYYLMALTCCLGLFITEKNKILKMIYLIAYAFLGYGLIYNNTFGCYLAFIVTLVLYNIYAIIKKTDRKLIFIAITIFVLLSGITSRDDENIAGKNLKQLSEDIQVINSKIMNKETEIINEKEVDVEEQFNKTGTGRMELWLYAIKFISEKPIIGYGPENLRDKYLRLRNDADRPHNLILQLACVSGIPGMLLYVSAVGIIVIKGIIYIFKNNKNGLIYLIVVVAYLGSSMFGLSIYYTSPYFFIFLGSLMNSNLEKQEE